MLTVGSCFSGIGGLEKGLEDTGGFETKWQIEYEPYAAAVLKKHWPKVKRYGDITKVNESELEPVDVICGGYPCQPFSVAGKRKGTQDERHLWPELLRIIRHLRPRYALLENVPGHLSMGFGRVLGDLAEVGYDAEWKVLDAQFFGVAQRRKRVFIIASPRERNTFPLLFKEEGSRRNDSAHKEMVEVGLCITTREGDRNDPSIETIIASTIGATPRGNTSFVWQDTYIAEADTNRKRKTDGIPNWTQRTRCLGNAVVPQVAQKIGEMILKYEGK